VYINVWTYVISLRTDICNQCPDDIYVFVVYLIKISQYTSHYAYANDVGASYGKPQEAYSLGGATGEEVVYIVY